MDRYTSLSQGYRKWKANAEEGKDLLSLEKALWSVLKDPNLLSSNKIILYQVYTLLRMFLGKRPSQYSKLIDLAVKEGYTMEEVHYCLMGKLILKMMPDLPKLDKKKKELGSEEEFGKYLYKTGEIKTKYCAEEFINDINDKKIEKRIKELHYEHYNINKYTEFSYIVYDLAIRHQAQLLAEVLKEEWEERELNVLCHDLEDKSEQGTNRLRNESKDNIYKLHERIRAKFKQTLEKNNFNEDVGCLFIREFLKKICHNCPPLPTYK